MSIFPSKDKDKMDEIIRRYLGTHFFKDKNDKNNISSMRYEEIEEFKFMEKDFTDNRLIDIFHYKYYTEIIIDLREFKKKDINIVFTDNILTIFDENRKFFKEIKFDRNSKIGITENKFNKGILRIKLVRKNT
ncbi:MAG: hypothetical protein EAX96_01835 [Candidatus Lokiarchaeota archaeon]|nr:hypothetical protein [Candidatus Lokiarchaeota archaeon]